MTSLERRREARYQRRKSAREIKKQQRYSECDKYENIISYKSLHKANNKSIKNVIWKASVQRYEMNLLRNIESARANLSDLKNISKGFVEFDLMERGRLRHIRSVHFSERVVQRSLCANSLVPILSRGLIYDNGACLPGKGVDRAMNRLNAHLQQFYRANGFSNEGYIAVFDFSGYFDCILHDVCFKKFTKEFKDERILWLLDTFIRPFGYPMGNTDMKRMKAPTSKIVYTGKSLGLGSEVSQITAVSYPNPLDHFIKQDLGIRWYGRYMDDGYMIFHNKEDAHKALNVVIEYAKTLGITINRKKTRVIKLSRGFKFLKARHLLTSSGKVVRRMSRDSITRQRRKLKKFAIKVRNGEMTVQDAATAYGSWKGYALHRGGKRTVRNMDKLFLQLFGEQPPRCKLEK